MIVLFSFSGIERIVKSVLEMPKMHDKNVKY